jgi:preprotein translocase subunit SecA
MNDQRKIIYEQRRDLMQADDIREMMTDMRHDVIDHVVRRHVPENSLPEMWDMEGLHQDCNRIFAIDISTKKWAEEEGISEGEIVKRIKEAVEAKIAAKETRYGHEMMRSVEKSLLLRVLDQSWKDHLLVLDHLRQGINLRAYAQSNPLNEYKREAFSLFQEMLEKIREETTAIFCHFEVEVPDNISLDDVLNPDIDFDSLEEQTPSWIDGEDDEEEEGEEEKPIKPRRTRKAEASDPKDPSTWGRVSRNAACPCGSGKKYKHCHGAIEAESAVG